MSGDNEGTSLQSTMGATAIVLRLQACVLAILTAAAFVFAEGWAGGVLCGILLSGGYSTLREISEIEGFLDQFSKSQSHTTPGDKL